MSVALLSRGPLNKKKLHSPLITQGIGRVPEMNTELKQITSEQRSVLKCR